MGHTRSRSGRGPLAFPRIPDQRFFWRAASGALRSLPEELQVSTTRSDRGCATTGCLIVLCFIPIVGHIILTLMILDDDLTTAQKILWLIVPSLLPPSIGQ